SSFKTAAGVVDVTQKSEGETCCQLNLAVGVRLNAFNLAEVSAGQVGIRIREFRGVEEVKCIPVKFQYLLIRDADVLLDAPVDHAVSRPEDLVAAQSSQTRIGS